MNDLTCQLMEVHGPPYWVTGAQDHALLYVQSASQSLASLVALVARLLAPRPCAAMLRVYGEVADPAHVRALDSLAPALTLLDRCEAVGIFDSADPARDRRSVLEQLHDRSNPDDDEACLIRAVHPRPVLFLHDGHHDLDVICTRADAERLLTALRHPPST